METQYRGSERSDVTAARRGGDTQQAMEGEPGIDSSSHEQAVFWRDTYQQILTMEESVLARVRELMANQSDTARREVELSNLPVISAQADRFRSRLGYWQARLDLINQEA